MGAAKKMELLEVVNGGGWGGVCLWWLLPALGWLADGEKQPFRKIMRFWAR